MIGKFLIQHIRNGEVVNSFECENPIITRGDVSDTQYVAGCHRSWVYNGERWSLEPNDKVSTLEIRGENPLGQVQSVSVITFPEPIVLNNQDELRIEWTEHDLIRASGSTICEFCRRLYFDHPYSDHRDYLGRPYLKKLCDGRIVKL